MTVLVTGAAGFVGSRLLSCFTFGEVVILGRKRPTAHGEFPFFEAEINSTNDYSSALKEISVVIHLAARVHVMEDHAENPLEEYREVNTRGTINLAKQAIQSGVKRFIFVSSIKSNGESTKLGQPFKYDDPRDPRDFYGQSKSEAEEQLLQLGERTGLEVVIIRPTLVYGPGVTGNFASLMRLVCKGFPLPVGCITDNRRSLVSVTNLVDLIFTCIEHPKAANQVFLVSDDHDLSTSEIVREMAISLDKQTMQVPVPLWCYRFIGGLLNKRNVVDRLVGSLQVDITHTKNSLDWKPPQTLEDGFNETAQALLKSKY